MLNLERGLKVVTMGQRKMFYLNEKKPVNLNVVDICMCDICDRIGVARYAQRQKFTRSQNSFISLYQSCMETGQPGNTWRLYGSKDTHCANLHLAFRGGKVTRTTDLY